MEPNSSQKQRNNFRNKQKFQNQQTFSHFVSIPLQQVDIKAKLQQIQKSIIQDFPESQRPALGDSNPDLFHLTIVMLALNSEQKKQLAIQAMKEIEKDIDQTISDSPQKCLEIDIGGVDCFRTKEKKNFPSQVTILYQHIEQNELIINLTDLIVRALMKVDILNPNDENFSKANITYDNKIGKFRASQYHLTLFRIRPQNVPTEKLDFNSTLEKYKDNNLGKYMGETIDISTRFVYDQITKFYLPFYQYKIKNQKLISKLQQDSQGTL